MNIYEFYATARDGYAACGRVFAKNELDAIKELSSYGYTNISVEEVG